MTIVKTRTVGNSTTVTIPSEYHVEPGVDYSVYRGVDGAIIFAPVLGNPFDDMEPFIMEDAFEGVRLLESEIA